MIEPSNKSVKRKKGQDPWIRKYNLFVRLWNGKQEDAEIFCNIHFPVKGQKYKKILLKEIGTLTSK